MKKGVGRRGREREEEKEEKEEEKGRREIKVKVVCVINTVKLRVILSNTFTGSNKKILCGK